MSDNEEEQFRIYREDPRIPCRYGAKCYQKNPAHHEKYKHPPAKDMKKGKGMKGAVKNKKRKMNDRNEASKDSSKKKIQKTDDDATDENLQSNVSVVDDNKHKAVVKEPSPDTTNVTKNVVNQCTIASLLKDCNIDTENDTVSENDVKTVISHLFLTEMPEDFYQLYKFCKSINEKDPLNALKDVGLQLVGPYDVFRQKFLSFKVESKESLLRHWRYYYDPPEFQTIIKADDKDSLHYGYWRDDISEDPVFVAKNKAAVNCLIEPVAENVFGAIDVHIGEKLKLANPFEKTHIAQLHQKLKNYAKENEIKLDKHTASMQAREKMVVARTFHKAGIVVPYNKKTELGYRSLSITDNELKKILEQINHPPVPEARKTPMSKLEEVIRLATIAADECDFGTCLELGHDLFSSGVSFVQNKALHMLSLAYSLLQRPQFLEIVQAHLKDRTKSLNPCAFLITSTDNE